MISLSRPRVLTTLVPASACAARAPRRSRVCARLIQHAGHALTAICGGCAAGCSCHCASCLRSAGYESGTRPDIVGPAPANASIRPLLLASQPMHAWAPSLPGPAAPWSCRWRCPGRRWRRRAATRCPAAGGRPRPTAPGTSARPSSPAPRARRSGTPAGCLGPPACAGRPAHGALGSRARAALARRAALPRRFSRAAVRALLDTSLALAGRRDAAGAARCARVRIRAHAGAPA